MWSYALRRLLAALPTLWAVVSLCYLMLHLTPGGPFDREHRLAPAVLANLQAKYHLGEPLWMQYLLYLRSLLQGDLGASFRYADWSVNALVARALPVSASIGGLALLLALLLGVLLGSLAALHHKRWLDHGLMLLGNLGGAVPSFVLGPALVLLFAIVLPLLPAGGWNDFEPRYMVLPVALLVCVNLASIARVMRAALLEVLGSTFVRAARAKGLPTHTIVLRHALRPALLPVLSLLGPLALSSISAAVVTESVFSLPGLGLLIVNGAANRDYTLVLGLVVLVTVLAVSFNLLVDLAYAWLDPRIRLG